MDNLAHRKLIKDLKFGTKRTLFFNPTPFTEVLRPEN